MGPKSLSIRRIGARTIRIHASIEPDPRILKSPLATHCCSQRLNHSAMTLRQKRIGTSWAVSHIGYNSESILGRNDSTVGCLHLALTYRYHFAWIKHNTSLSTDSRVNTNYKRFASWSGCRYKPDTPGSYRHPSPPTSTWGQLIKCNFIM